MLPLLLISWLSFFHPFFVSVTEVKHNEKAKTLEVSAKFFSNDLEEALEKTYGQKIDILKPAEQARLTPLLQDYFKKHLQVTVDGKPVAFRFLGYELEEDATWCYLEGVKVNQVKKMEVRNDLLFDQFPAQTNMMHITARGKRQSIKLDNPTSQAAFRF